MLTKIQKAEERFDTIINNTLESDNTKLVDARIKESEQVWNRRLKKLEKQFKEKVSILDNKSYDLDQIRLAVATFEEDTDKIKHWCLMAGVHVKDCYSEVQERLALLGRNSLKINELLRKIEVEGDL